MRHRQEGAPLADVVREDGPIGTSVVALGDGPEPLLAGCVPNLELKGLTQRHVSKGQEGQPHRPMPRTCVHEPKDGSRRSPASLRQ